MDKRHGLDTQGMDAIGNHRSHGYTSLYNQTNPIPR